MILRNVLSQFFIVKCFSKSLLVRNFSDYIKQQYVDLAKAKSEITTNIFQKQLSFRRKQEANCELRKIFKRLRHVTSMSYTHKPAIQSCDAGERITYCNSCQLTTIWMSNINLSTDCVVCVCLGLPASKCEVSVKCVSV